MKSIVTKFPGVKCHYFKRGKCLYEEARNPGLHRDFRCKALLTLEDEFDTFLDRAEYFQLEEELMWNIWEKRMRHFTLTEATCPMYQPGHEEGSGVGCSYAFFDICLEVMPSCEGICRRYTHKKDNEPKEIENGAHNDNE